MITEVRLSRPIFVPTTEAKGSLKPEEVITHCKKNLSAYKVPRIIEFREELPLSPPGRSCVASSRKKT